MKLVAKVNFQDVDGNSIQKTYNHGCDLYGLIDSMNYNMTDKDNFSKTKKPLYPGINGIVDITKKISIVIYPADEKQ